MSLPNIVEYGSPILLEEAKAVISAAEQEAITQGLAVIIVVVDSAAQLVAMHRLDHAQFGSIDVAISKAENSVRFKRPTAAFEDALAQGGIHLRLLSIEGVKTIAGGIPLLKDGKIIGAIGVAGMLPEQDLQVAKAGAVIFSNDLAN